VDIVVYKKQETIDWWKSLLIEEELVDRSVLIYRCGDISPDLAIPLGKFRRTGYLSCSVDDIREGIFRKLKERPFGFPNLRYGNVNLARFMGTREIEWGDDVTDLWRGRDGGGEMAAESHRALGRAFGYKEERIMEMYPLGWRRGQD